MKKCLFLLAILVLILQPGLSSLPGRVAQGAGEKSLAPTGQVLYVKPLGTGNCSTWATACELKPALAAAAPGDELWVQQGTYKPDFWENLTDFTFVAWVYWRGGDAWQRIFDFGKDTQNYLMLTPKNYWEKMNFEIRVNDSLQRLEWEYALPDNSWQHVALTLSGDSAILYLNGAKVAESTAITYNPNQATNGDNLWLGRSQFEVPPYVDPYFNGNLDEIALFNRALSQSEIQGILGNGWATTPGKVLALHLDENPASNGTPLLDSFENGYGGILNTDNDSANKSVSGQIGQALSLDGTGDYVTLRTRRQGTFRLKSGVAVYGGFAGTETSRGQRNWAANLTTLSGDIGLVGNTSDNSYHVVTGSGVDGTAILDGFTVTGGNASPASYPNDSGGGMYNNQGSPSIANVTFIGNTATNWGGGMYNSSSNPSLANVTFSGNSATNWGGGMYNSSSNPSLANVTFSGNSAYTGGGMYNYNNSNPTLANVTFSGNTATVYGGGMYNETSSPSLANVTFSGNSATSMGGGTYNFNSNPTLANVTFSGNTASNGGGMYNYAGSPSITNVTFSGNSASDGGGMYNAYSSPMLVNVTFSSNTATTDGGGMHNYSSSPALTNVTFSGNSASDGGGMYNFNSSPTLANVTFSGNSATNFGGGMFNDSSSPALTNVTFSGNSASGGGGMYNYENSSPTLADVTFTGNTATNNGGGMYNDASNPVLTNVTFSSNTATNFGGGMYNNSSNPTLANAILWGNAPGQIYNDASTPVVTYSDVQGGCPAGATCTAVKNLNPQFLRNPSPGADTIWGTPDDDYGDLRLRLTSPAIDAGDNSAVPPDTLDLDVDGNTTEPLPYDLGGHARFVDVLSVVDSGPGTAPIVDMGAYEAPPDVIYVDLTAAGANSGLSWSDAMTDLQSALNWAVGGVEIWVAEGTYKPTAGTGRSATFALKSGVGVYGGFAGTETSRDQRNWAANLTTLSGDIGVVGNTSDNSYHVVTGSGVDGTAVLDGFTITGGNASAASYPNDSGGGMVNNQGSPSIANLTFSGNSAYLGGGMFNDNNSNPTLANVTFSGNAASRGGGMYNNQGNPNIANVTFSGNSATNSGGGMDNVNSSPTLANVTFNGNSATIHGGGMDNGNSSPSLANVTFSGNKASGNGGGMYNYSSSPMLTNVTFSGNSASKAGGMYNYSSNPALANVTFSGNTATNNGGAMYNDSSNPSLANVTLSGNTATNNGGGMYNRLSSPSLANAILWGNAPGQIYNDASTPVVSYSDVQGGCPAGATCSHVKNVDPQFVRNPSPGADGKWGTSDDDYGDLRVRFTSPAIDAGDNAAVPPGILTDLLGLPRFVDIPTVVDTGSGTAPIVDMGAYEAQIPIYIYLPLVKR